MSALNDGSWEASDKHTFASSEKDALPKTTTIDLGAATPISQVIFGVPPFGSTKTVRVSLSADRQNLARLAASSSLRPRAQAPLLFLPTSVHYVRHSHLDCYGEQVGYAPNLLFITEAKVYILTP